MRYSLLMALLCLNVGCGLRFHENTENPGEILEHTKKPSIPNEVSEEPSPVSGEPDNKENQFKFDINENLEIIAGKEPNQYQVSIKNDLEEDLYIKKEFIRDGSVYGFVLKAGETFIDGMVVPSEKYRFVVSEGDGEDQKNLGESVLTIPFDVVLSERTDFTKYKKDKILISANRVFLEKGSEITTNGIDFVIEAKTLISEGSIIQTFQHGQTASRGNIGRSGGNIAIYADVAMGELTVNLVGENGGEGIQPGQPQRIPGRAPNGDDAISEYVCIRHEPFLDGDLVPTDDAMMCAQMGDVCKRQPGNGLQGKSGDNGSPADNGKSGGSTGDLYVKIKKSSLFKIRYKQILGIGGSPSGPGIGGFGQLGGLPGKHARGCKVATEGPEGQNGADGAFGIRGEDGKIGRVCINLDPESGDICEG